MNICVMGTSVSSGNRGVLALGASLVGLCLRASPKAQVKLLLNHDKADTFRVRLGGHVHDIPVVPARLSPRSRLQEHLVWIVLLSILYRFLPPLRPSIRHANIWIRTVAEAHIIGDIRGGDSFSDIYGMKRFFTGFFMAWSVLLVKRDMVQFPQTYGPYKGRLATILARYLLRCSSTIVARDKKSQSLAQDLVGENRQVLLSPDVAFSLEAIHPENVLTEPPLANPAGKGVIGLNVNGLMYNGGYTRNNMFGLKLDYTSFLSTLVIALLRESSGELWLVPHTYAAAGSVESDPEASQKLRDGLLPEFRDRVRIVTGEYDQNEIKGVVGMCDFFVGSRMHSCIAALSQGIPCVGVAYSMKFGGVFESVGMEDWVVDGREMGNEDAVGRIVELYRQREAVQDQLGRRAAEARTQLGDVFADLTSKPAGSSQSA